MWYIFQLIFLASMILMTISCVIVTAQSCDALSLLLLGNAWGLQVTPRPRFVASCPAGAWQCAGEAAFAAVSARNGTIISIGYLLTVAITLPLALIDVSESFQAASYFISLACLFWLVVKFAIMAGRAHAADHADHVLPPLLAWNPALALEVSFWSWTISFAVPMWLDEKEPAAPLSTPLIASFAHRAALDVMLGFTGAAAFPHMPPTTLNILQAVNVHPSCGTATKAAGIIFVVSSLASNIVDYAMVRVGGSGVGPEVAGEAGAEDWLRHARPSLSCVRRPPPHPQVAVRNLECHVGSEGANGLGVFLPFLMGFVFYFGESFADLINLASPLLNGAIQFAVPALLFWAYARFETEPELNVLGVRLSTAFWRYSALALAVLTGVLIVAAYVLTAAATTSDDDYS